MSNILCRRRLVGGLCAAVAAVLAATLVQAPAARADYAYGCFFAAYTPYKSTTGTIWSKVLIRCDRDTRLIVTGNLKKDRFGPDATVGSISDTQIYAAGRYYTYWVSNNRDACPGSGSYFGVAAIRPSSFATAYTSRSPNAYISHC